MRKLIRGRAFYKYFGILVISLAFQNLLVYSVSLADNLMLGAYSETALSGSALCNQIQFLLQMLVVGAGEGAVVLGSQYWGKGKLEPIPHIIGVTLRFGVGMAAVMFIFALAMPGTVLGLLTDDQAVITEGVKYLRIICFTYLIFTATNILTASLRSIGIVSIGYIISAATLVINICLNYCLIYGNLGFPELGIRGAACATLVSRCAELLIVIIYLKYREHKLNLTLKKLIKINSSYMNDYVHVSFPVLINQAQWGIAQMIQTAILGHMGAAAIAANSIATIVFQVISVAAYGAASASGMTIGRTIGEGSMERLHEIVHTLQVIFIIIGVVSGSLIFLVRVPILNFYHISSEAHRLALQFMGVLAVTTVGTSYQMACDNGIIRGGGDTSFSMKMNTVSMWGIVVPLSAIAAFVFKCPPAAVFFLLKSDQLYKIVPVVIHLNKWNWVKQVTRTEG
ncbi:MATE family efflux transporter [Anaerostipes caccae]|uniref:MATE family efflux transporter n=1 Tax=Anaerostipes caccae TaxID=105841 RepID=UPI00241E8C14|nr:MATE family efflux transporter [Anaerostipes caccae]